MKKLVILFMFTLSVIIVNAEIINIHNVITQEEGTFNTITGDFINTQTNLRVRFQFVGSLDSEDVHLFQTSDMSLFLFDAGDNYIITVTSVYVSNDLFIWKGKKSLTDDAISELFFGNEE